MLTKEDVSLIEEVLDKRFNQFDQKIGEKLKRELKPIKEDMTKTRKDINVIVSLFDREYVDLRKRVERIEEHLQIPQI